MEKPTEAEALHVEYLDLLKTMYGTCLTGISRAKAHMDVSFFGMLVTQGALLGSIFFIQDLDDRAMVAILVIVVVATLWWFRTVNKVSISRTSFRFFCTKSSWASNHDIVPIFS
jgi:hypothetical protein